MIDYGRVPLKRTGAPLCTLVISAALILTACPLWLPCALATDQPTVIDLWAEVKVPPAPELASVEVSPKTTALLILDIEKRTTNMERRPRAVASVPVIRKFLDRARQAGMLVVFSTTSMGNPEDILPEVTPHKDEQVVKSSVDKFFMTNLDDILRKKGITTVIVVGTAAEGAVVHTATAASMRSLAVIVPVDGISSSDLYAEQYVCWHLLNAPGSRNRTTLTLTDLIEITR